MGIECFFTDSLAKNGQKLVLPPLIILISNLFCPLKMSLVPRTWSPRSLISRTRPFQINNLQLYIFSDIPTSIGLWAWGKCLPYLKVNIFATQVLKHFIPPLPIRIQIFTREAAKKKFFWDLVLNDGGEEGEGEGGLGVLNFPKYVFLAMRTNLSPKCVPVIQLFLTLLIIREEMEAAVERDEFLEVHICWWHPDFCLSYPGAKLQWLYTTLSQTVTNVLNVCAYAPPKIVQKLWLLYGHCINSIGTFCHDFTTQQ